MELTELSLRIHGNPELSSGGREFVPLAGGVPDRTRDSQVTKPAYGLPTAFEAVYGEGNPSIGIIAEYDALPGIGHGLRP